MKKCPKCHAEIEENARFCLYCMTSFESKREIETPKEKNKRWLYIILAAVLVFVIIGACLWIPARKNGSSNNSSSTYSGSHPEQEESSVSSDSSQNAETVTNAQGSAGEGNNSRQDSLKNNAQNNSSNKTSGSGTSQSSGTGANTTTSSTTSNTVSNNSTTVQQMYSYVEATRENAYPTGYAPYSPPVDSIVITKVNYVEKSGNYVIPDTIDGKKVRAIMPLAFSDASVSSSVKSVTLPTSVKTLWSDSFKNCYNLKDLYIKSGAIGIYTDAFPETSSRTATLTIHCKKDCRDFNFYYYSNISSKYDANYEEWNG